MSFFFKHLRANRGGVPVMLALQGVLFLMGFLLVVLINAFLNEDRDYAAIGSMMALMGSVFGGLLRGRGAPVRYRMALSMGHTRRAYLLADPVITALNCLIGVWAAWLLNKLELWLYGLLYPGWELEFDAFDEMVWWHILVLVAAVCLLDFCLGALQLRFGAKGFAIIWIPLCFSPGIITSSINAASSGSASLLAQIGHGILFLVGLLSPAMWAGAGVLVLLVLVVLSVICYCRAEVRI